MMIVVVYDVDTCSEGGTRRLQMLAKECLNWGRRLQSSVYECEVNAEQYREMVSKLSSCIDPKKDSLRLYNLGNHYETRIVDLAGNNSNYSDGFIL